MKYDLDMEDNYVCPSLEIDGDLASVWAPNPFFAFGTPGPSTIDGAGTFKSYT